MTQQQVLGEACRIARGYAASHTIRPAAVAADPPLVLLRRRGSGRRGGVGSHHIPVVSKGGTFRRKSPSFAAVW